MSHRIYINLKPHCIGGGQKSINPRYCTILICQQTKKLIKTAQTSVHPIPETVMGRQVSSKQPSHEVRTSILDMHDTGAKQCDIAEYYKLDSSKVSKFFKRKRNQESERRSGWKKILSPRDTRKLTKVVDDQRFKPIHTITSTYNQFVAVKIIARTVHRTLKSNGISNYVAVSKSYLSSKNLQDRIIWTNHHDTWDYMLWEKVVFSVESSFTIRPAPNNGRVWRKAYTKFNLRNIVLTFKSGYVTAFVWGAFSAHAITLLVRINGTLKQDKYKKILEDNIMP